MAALSAVMVLGAKKLVSIASEAEETRSKFNAVFKEMTISTRSWVDEFSEAVGRSKIDVESWMARLQDTFVPLGFARDKSAELAKELTKLAVDVASFNNATDEETIGLFTSALVGNHEAVRRFGIMISESTLKQEALNQGWTKSYKNLTDLEKVQLRFNVIMKSSADAQGDAVRTVNEHANVTKRAKAEIKDMAASLGNLLMPTFTLVTKGAGTAATAIKSFADALKTETLDDYIQRLKELGAEQEITARLSAELALLELDKEIRKQQRDIEIATISRAEAQKTVNEATEREKQLVIEIANLDLARKKQLVKDQDVYQKALEDNLGWHLKAQYQLEINEQKYRRQTDAVKGQKKELLGRSKIAQDFLDLLESQESSLRTQEELQKLIKDIEEGRYKPKPLKVESVDIDDLDGIAIDAIVTMPNEAEILGKLKFLQETIRKGDIKIPATADIPKQEIINQINDVQKAIQAKGISVIELDKDIKQKIISHGQVIKQAISQQMAGIEQSIKTVSLIPEEKEKLQLLKSNLKEYEDIYKNTVQAIEGIATEQFSIQQEQFQMETAMLAIRNEHGGALLDANKEMWQKYYDKQRSASEDNLRTIKAAQDEERRLLEAHAEHIARIQGEIGLNFSVAMGQAIEAGRPVLKAAMKGLLQDTIEYIQREILLMKLIAAIRAVKTLGVSALIDAGSIVAVMAMFEVAKAGIANYQQGIGFVSQSQPAIIHQGERVMSATENRDVSESLGRIETALEQRSGGDTYNINAIDTMSFRDYMRRGGYAVIREDVSRGRFVI